MSETGDPAVTVITTNKSAFHHYFIEETYEAGLMLLGTEVKSLREGRVNLKEGFVRVLADGAFLYQCHISPYAHGTFANHEPTRTRKLLLNKRQLQRLYGKTQQKGLTLVPLKIYFKGAVAKVEIALARGKKLYDKREAEAKRSAAMAINRAVRGGSRAI